MGQRSAKDQKDQSSDGDSTELDYSFFAFLPPEVMVRIFDHLNLIEQCRARRVCKRWEVVLTSKPVLRHVTLHIPTFQVVKPALARRALQRVGSQLETLAVVGFRSDLVKRASEYLLSLAITAIERVPATSFVDVSFSDCTLFRSDVYKLALASRNVRSITLNNSNLLIKVGSSMPGMHMFDTMVSFFIPSPCRVFISDAPDRQSKAVILETTMCNWARDSWICLGIIPNLFSSNSNLHNE